MNFDPLIIELIRETECFIKMKIDVPRSAQELFLRRDKLRKTDDRLKVCKHMSGNHKF